MVTPTHRGTGMRVSAPCMMLNLKSFLLFSIDLLSRGGGGSSNTGLSTFIDFFFWKKLFSFWCNTLEWRSLHLHFPVQHCLVYVWWLNGTCKDSFWSQLFSSGFPRATRLFSMLFSLLYLGYVMADLCYPSEAVQYWANLWFC